MSELPVDTVLPELRRALATRTAAVLHAPPGAGKTTRVPVALLHEPWLEGQRIVMLEPRRLAARSAARYMASTLGEAVGGTVGYRTRMDTRVGPQTRIEVVTEGILSRMIQSDSSLEGTGLVIFDEFHERSLQADLGLALSLEVQQALRPDLRLLVMSATLDGEAVSRLLDEAPVLRSEGRRFPVEVHYADRRNPDPVTAAADTVREALQSGPGSVLVFLPGVGEIRRSLNRLESLDLPTDVDLVPLFGDLSPGEQDRAIAPAPAGRRKVVLATSIAETSLTIEGIAAVVDTGLSRESRFDPHTGMSRLETVRSSRASAEQRCGRAGRLGPGRCYRLWSAHENETLPVRSEPEILHADLAPLALELAEWGVTDPATLAWQDPPPSGSYAQARELLTRLGAVDPLGRITPHGRAMAALHLHPRLSHMVLRARDLGRGGMACELAALLGERDPLRRDAGPREADLRLRLQALWGEESPREREALEAQGYRLDRATLKRCRTAARRWRERLGLPEAPHDAEWAGALLALAYPDRIAQQRPGDPNRYRLSNGRGARLAETEPMSTTPYLVAADLDAGEREARIFLAAPLDLDALDETTRDLLLGDNLHWRERIGWDDSSGELVARRELRLDALVLAQAPIENPDPETLRAAVLDGIRSRGLDLLPWTAELREWRQRIAFLRNQDEQEGRDGEWPDLSDTALLESLETWLAPYLTAPGRKSPLAGLDLRAALTGLLTWEQQRQLDILAPTHLEVPTGSRIRLQYGPEGPVLAVRLQELFGLVQTPRVAGGRVPVTLHLLSPARRPVQVTRDLESFWRNTYHEVKKDLKGRYPKHAWPDDPLAAPPTRTTRRR